jgi:hypothetical protein
MYYHINYIANRAEVDPMLDLSSDCPDFIHLTVLPLELQQFTPCRS